MFLLEDARRDFWLDAPEALEYGLISKVVDGSRLAATAGEQMKKTKDSTENLVYAVRQIAERSNSQAKISKDLQGRYERIRESSQKTSAQLTEQTKQTRQLVKYAKGLLEAVQVFKLPKPKAVTRNQMMAAQAIVAPVQVQHKKAS